MVTMSNEVKMTVLMRRLEGATFEEISKEVNFSKQAISMFLQNLSGKRLSAKDCPFSAFRKWFNDGTLSLEDVAREIGVSWDTLQSALMVAGYDPMDRDIANKLSDLTEIPVEELMQNCRPKPSTGIYMGPSNKTAARVIYPAILERMKERNLSIRALSFICEKPYNRIYRTISIYDSQPMTPERAAVRRDIASALGLTVEQAFSVPSGILGND